MKKKEPPKSSIGKWLHNEAHEQDNKKNKKASAFKKSTPKKTDKK